MMNTESALRASRLIYSLADLGHSPWWERTAFGLDEGQMVAARAVADEAADRLKRLFSSRARRGWATRRAQLPEALGERSPDERASQGSESLDREDHQLWFEQNGKLLADMFDEGALHPTLIWVGGYLYVYVGLAVRRVASAVLRDLQVARGSRPAWASEELLWQCLVALTNPQHASPRNLVLLQAVVESEGIEILDARCRLLCADFLEQEAQLREHRLPRIGAEKLAK